MGFLWSTRGHGGYVPGFPTCKCILLACVNLLAFDHRSASMVQVVAVVVVVVAVLCIAKSLMVRG